MSGGTDVAQENSGPSEAAAPVRTPPVGDFSSRIVGAFWRLGVMELFRKLESGAGGLTGVEATRRLSICGPNEPVVASAAARFAKIRRRLSDPLVLILVIAAAVSAMTGDRTGFFMIAGIVVASIALEAIQEHRADRAAEALRRSVSLRADALRDGRCVDIPARAVVPGDVIELRAGDLVPADGVVLEARHLFANQASLTGESWPIAKTQEPASSDDLSEAGNALFMGSSIVSGSGRMLVVATGARTRFGAIASLLGEDAPRTAFERAMREFGGLVARLTAFLALLVLLAHLAFARPVIDSFLFALALAVGLTPELLPMIMTVTLTRGALRLAKGGVIVKRMSAIHSFGELDVLCTDKTGTLTQARIALTGHIRGNGESDERVFEFVWLNAKFETGVKSALDEAILAHGEPVHSGAWTKIDEAPFDFERRRVSVLVDDGERRLLVCKGAPEDILARCDRDEDEGGEIRDIDEARRAAIAATHDRLAADGQRLLGVAWRDRPLDCTTCAVADEEKLIFAGYAVFIDPPKASAAATIENLARAGVEIKIVSGDNELVVGHVARELGIRGASVLIGREVDRLDDEALAVRADATTLFCRVDPEQKNRILRALQSRGHVVGYLGDGVNDAPSLKAADIGISVEGATDVARQAADIIMTKPDLEMVAKGVEEGRRTFANIRKYVLMGTSSNFGNMFSMAIASLFLPFLPMLPAQILLNNLVYDLSEIGIPFDRVDPEDEANPQVWDMRELRRFMLTMGLVSSAFDIATFISLRMLFNASPEIFRTAWFMESMATQILVIFIIRTRATGISRPPHWALLASSLCALTFALWLPMSSFGAWFDFVPIDAPLAATLGLIVIGYLCAVELAKAFSSRMFDAARTRPNSR